VSCSSWKLDIKLTWFDTCARDYAKCYNGHSMKSPLECDVNNREKAHHLLDFIKLSLYIYIFGYQTSIKWRLQKYIAMSKNRDWKPRKREGACSFHHGTLLIRETKSPRSNQEVGFGENYLRSLLSSPSLLDPTLLDYAVLLLFMGVVDLLPCLLWRRTKLVGWCFWFRASVIMTSRFWTSKGRAILFWAVVPVSTFTDCGRGG